MPAPPHRRPPRWRAHGCRRYERRSMPTRIIRGEGMSWLQKQLPPKIKSTSEKKGVPEGLWVKCEGCDTVLYATDLGNSLYVCPKCGFHHRISARTRIDLLLDAENRFEIGSEV